VNLEYVEHDRIVKALIPSCYVLSEDLSTDLGLGAFLGEEEGYVIKNERERRAN
jgi:hypothetical protein